MTITLKEFDERIGRLARNACKDDNGLTVWNDWSWFYDSPDGGWPVDPFWADDDYDERSIVIHDDKTENLAVVGVNWHSYDYGDAEGPYMYARILEPAGDDDGDGLRVTCGDDIVRTFRNEEEDACTPPFHAEGRVEADGRDYTLYAAPEDVPTPEEWFGAVLTLLTRNTK